MMRLFILAPGPSELRGKEGDANWTANGALLPDCARLNA